MGGAGDSVRLNAAFDRFAARNRSSEMWKAFLTAGAKHPQTLGAELEPVLWESLFLTHEDYRYGGVLLFAALHKSGDTAQRKRLERTILELPQLHGLSMMSLANRCQAGLSRRKTNSSAHSSSQTSCCRKFVRYETNVRRSVRFP